MLFAPLLLARYCLTQKATAPHDLKRFPRPHSCSVCFTPKTSARTMHGRRWLLRGGATRYEDRAYSVPRYGLKLSYSTVHVLVSLSKSYKMPISSCTRDHEIHATCFPIKSASERRDVVPHSLPKFEIRASYVLVLAAAQQHATKLKQLDILRMILESCAAPIHVQRATCKEEYGYFACFSHHLKTRRERVMSVRERAIAENIPYS